MKQFFKELLEYNHYTNQKLWNIFNENPVKISEKAIKLYSHILNAHQIWNNRIEPQKPVFGVWEVHPIEICSNIDKKNYEQSLLILDKLDLNGIINYKNTQGKAFTNSISNILFHVINHSTYHRGQIATEFKQNELDPLATDYIIYKR
jgi:uncharacterized damage-inducible protein DinB